jgi:hypothetical protein
VLLASKVLPSPDEIVRLLAPIPYRDAVPQARFV